MKAELLVQFGHSQNFGHLQQYGTAFWLVLFAQWFILPLLAGSLSSDGVALLKFKAAIKSDPLGVLSSWRADDLDPCSWTGITCDPQSKRVVSVNITGEVFCVSSEGGFQGSLDGFGGGSPQSCPSLAFQYVGFQCSPSKIPKSTVPVVPVCLKNGRVVLSSAQYSSRERIPCQLAGSLSPAIGSLDHLRVLALPFNGISGYLPREVGNLSNLEVLDVRVNAMSGFIPVEIGRLSKLQVLNLGQNSFQGEIPSELSRCLSLSNVNLAGNLLSGNIPRFLGKLPALITLDLSFNQLDGIIPDELSGDCRSLEHLRMEGNFLFGTISSGFGNCSNLKSLVVSSNFLSGPIPSELGRLQSLEVLDVSRNSFAGFIPEELGNCSNLSVLVITNTLDAETCFNRTMVDPVDGYSSKDVGEFNYFTGALPVSITRLPNLWLLWAPSAGFLATFPSDWGSCLSLEVLNLGGNSFSGEISVGLTKCRKLVYLDLSSNSLEGSIHAQFATPCMIVFNASGNFLSGAYSSPTVYDCPRNEFLWTMLRGLEGVPVNPDYSYFMSLYYGSVIRSLPMGLLPQRFMLVHDLSSNNLTGPLPKMQISGELLNKFPTYALYLSENDLSGPIPDYIFSICANLQGFSVVVSHNLLEGGLPVDSLRSCKSLTHFEAASNFLNGSIPPNFQEIQGLAYIDLQGNKLHGHVPAVIGRMKDLQFLILARNSLNGTIPWALGDLWKLIMLDLSCNQLSGEIPPSLANLHALEYLLLNNNSLSGTIPAGLARIISLAHVNVAYNNLSGVVPTTMDIFCSEMVFVGNPYLQPCRAPALSPVPDQDYVPRSSSLSPPTTSMQKGNRASVGLIVVIITGALMVGIFSLLAICCLFNKQHCLYHHVCGPHGEKEVVVFANLSVCLTYDSVVRATGNFSLDNLIGYGGFGATYKAELKPGLLLAVKRLFIGRVQGVQQFVAEVHTLGRIRHAHLVTLIGYHASESEMFLIYNYLPGGNLETLLEKRVQDSISWKVLHKIALDVAEALEFLHNGCHPRVLHRDIKPSNILLDRSLNAYLSDFGLARFLGVSETHATTDVAGTFGYVSPEYATTGRVSDKADVYSYGVVLLEVLSGRKIYDPSYGEGNITAWADNLYGKGITFGEAHHEASGVTAEGLLPNCFLMKKSSSKHFFFPVVGLCCVMSALQQDGSWLS